ncbi:radical SAM protein, partial [Candidatus Fermentibacteria bacterium]|nr:radical SAM protein [Candidatus Fermentibacteria bacterium]
IVSIPTNGTLTENICSGVSEMLDRLPRRVRLEIELSLDGIGGAHDFVRGVEGCFDRLVRTAERLRRIRDGAGGRLTIKTVTTAVRSNEASLREIVSFGRREIGADRVVLSPPHGTGPVEDEIRSLDFSVYSASADEVYAEEVRRSPAFMDRVFSAVQLEAASTMRRIHEGTGAVPCPGPDSICVIAEDGWVFACEDVRFPLGRIQDHGYSLQRVLAGGAAHRFRRGIRGCRRCVWPCGVLARMVTDPSVMVRSASSALVRKAEPRRRVASFDPDAGECRMEDI